jgi:hypothetical protein
VFLQWKSATFSVEHPPILFQFSGRVLVAWQWKFCFLFPLRQRIVVAMEVRRDELCFIGCSSYWALLLSFIFLSRSNSWFYFWWGSSPLKVVSVVWVFFFFWVLGLSQVGGAAVRRVSPRLTVTSLTCFCLFLFFLCFLWVLGFFFWSTQQVLPLLFWFSSRPLPY